jgi:type II secretory ATPase GspE/PulE/Tfp pilus assembly ATPase PilB-like protein
MLIDAINMRASDLHFEPYEYNYRVRFPGRRRAARDHPAADRHQGQAGFAHQGHQRWTSPRKRVPQDGRMKLKFGRQGDRLPRQHAAHLFGEKIVIRILDPSQRQAGHRRAGLREDREGAPAEGDRRPYGMILVTGPTGSGKTVSLYTCLNILNQPGVNISTAKTRRKSTCPASTRSTSTTRPGLTFAAALKSFLRQDPDIIMVGEIRDLETADIAIKAAQTGHLVMSTLHTNDAPTTDAPANMGIAPFNIASSVHPDHGPALARRLCENCKTPRTTRVKRLLEAGFRPKTISTAAGSPTGRRLLGLQQRLQGPRRHLPGDADHRGDPAHHPGEGTAMDIAARPPSEGVRDLRQSGLVKVRAGVTTLEEVITSPTSKSGAGSGDTEPQRRRGFMATAQHVQESKDAIFEWEGKDRNGKVVRGEIRAGGEAVVSASLRRQGILVTKVKKRRTSGGKSIKQKDIAIFTRQLATMMKAGVPLLQSFDIVARGSTNPRMTKLLNDIRTDVETGTSLSCRVPQAPDALRRAVLQPGRSR